MTSCAGVLADRSQFFKDLSVPFYGYNRPRAKVLEGVRESFWLQGMMEVLGVYWEVISQGPGSAPLPGWPAGFPPYIGCRLRAPCNAQRRR